MCKPDTTKLSVDKHVIRSCYWASTMYTSASSLMYASCQENRHLTKCSCQWARSALCMQHVRKAGTSPSVAVSQQAQCTHPHPALCMQHVRKAGASPSVAVSQQAQCTHPHPSLCMQHVRKAGTSPSVAVSQQAQCTHPHPALCMQHVRKASTSPSGPSQNFSPESHIPSPSGIPYEVHDQLGSLHWTVLGLRLSYLRSDWSYDSISG